MNYNLPYSDQELIPKINCSQEELELFKAAQKKALREAEAYKKRFFSKQITILGISGSMRRVNDCPQEHSTTEWLLEAALKKARELGAKTEILRLRDNNIQPCKGCYSTTNTQCHFPCSCYPLGKYGDDMTNKLYGKVLQSEGIIFATPIHNFKISSLMSLFIDRLISMDGSLSPANPHEAKNRELNIKHTKFIELTASDQVLGSGFLRRFTGKVAGIIVSGHEAGAAMTISSLFMTLNHFGMIFPPFSNMYAMGNILNSTHADKKKLETNEYAEEAQLLAKNVFNTIKIVKQNPQWFWEYDAHAN
ncbi:flavodoxin family protein [Candidatus Woesearchaeota archaeon]|nr:flavodoxin family protein [Candidatus Woesearchaeota archaeon]